MLFQRLASTIVPNNPFTSVRYPVFLANSPFLQLVLTQQFIQPCLKNLPRGFGTGMAANEEILRNCPNERSQNVVHDQRQYKSGFLY